MKIYEYKGVTQPENHKEQNARPKKNAKVETVKVDFKAVNFCKKE